MHSFIRAALIALILSPITIAHASTFACDGKEMTKGEVIKTLINNPKAKCTKTDLVVFDGVKGTIRNAPKD